jgi:hypothetical protein
MANPIIPNTLELYSSIVDRYTHKENVLLAE